MKDLLESLAQNFDDAEGSIHVATADWFADDLRLELSIRFHDDRWELWEVSCSGVVEESLSSASCDTLVISADSPLLHPFIEPDMPIMFSHNALAPETLFGIVCSCCIEVTGKPESIPRFINGIATSEGICSSAYGLLGRFPASLGTRILEALQDKPIQVIGLPGHLATRWNGTEHVPYGNLQVLEIGNSYVIADCFSAQRA
ncbi:hypothetical protein [Pseudoduganella sp. GCM10020061]|uniref:hypothetical protein n=1 Tax=Pseudoduganella sp. GCM10020061 TaxID=3317345 RepID=UPI00362B30BD